MSISQITKSKIVIDGCDIKYKLCQIKRLPIVIMYEDQTDPQYREELYIKLNGWSSIEYTGAPLNYEYNQKEDTYYFYGILKELPKREEWMLAYLAAYDMPLSAKYHGASDVFKTDMARGFKRGYEIQISRIESLQDQLNRQVKVTY